MNEPPLPLDETSRLMSLQSLRILDTSAEERFDRITRMTQRYFGVDICLVSLVDSDRQWFKSRQGTEVCETDRRVSFCGHAILGDEIFIVGDAAHDPRFDDNPLVTGPPHIRFYAGCPIHGPLNRRIGTLCLIDSRPRGLSVEDQATLRDFAAMVEDELALATQTAVDELTQVSNRRGFNTAARHILPLCRRLDTRAALLYFDLDGLKAVNDGLGHVAGDDLLKAFAKLLARCFRSADVIARLGGDEFAVLLAGSPTAAATALERLDRMKDELGEPVRSRLRWSVGQVDFEPERHANIESMLAEADADMYEHKVGKRHIVGWSV